MSGSKRRRALDKEVVAAFYDKHRFPVATRVGVVWVCIASLQCGHQMIRLLTGAWSLLLSDTGTRRTAAAAAAADLILTAVTHSGQGRRG